MTMPQQRLLVVDDEAAVRFAITDYFSNYGYRVDCAATLAEAEALLAGVPYALVLADLRLSGTTGTEGLAIIRYVHERSPATVTILLSAHLSPEIENTARRAGAAATFSKDASLSAIEAVVFDLLGRHTQ